MTTSSKTCPVCGRPVDPLRSRAVGVKDGKVVAYDRAECKAAAEAQSGPVSQPVLGRPAEVVVEDKELDVRVTLRTPAKGVPAITAAPPSPAETLSPSFETGPVITVVRDDTPLPAATRADATPVMKKPAASAAPARRNKRLDTDTRHLQPPEDYDDSDLGPPSEPEPVRSPPYLLIIIVVALATAAIAVAFGMN